MCDHFVMISKSDSVRVALAVDSHSEIAVKFFVHRHVLYTTRGVSGRIDRLVGWNCSKPISTISQSHTRKAIRSRSESVGQPGTLMEEIRCLTGTTRDRHVLRILTKFFAVRWGGWKCSLIASLVKSYVLDFMGHVLLAYLSTFLTLYPVWKAKAEFAVISTFFPSNCSLNSFQNLSKCCKNLVCRRVPSSSSCSVYQILHIVWHR